ncbi:hypothetical protein DFH09DRAFT_1321246 [Mycena vulgaris]|nr:hypothetical protein DFH09DRAFT_1321246 [Mycena vulgaris]
MTYVKGVGLEAQEGCKLFTTYLKHADTFDTYHGLMLVLCSKYRRALGIKSMHVMLRESMRELGVQSCDEFETWRAKEKAHLCTLSKEPEEETLEMEYFQKLVNLRDAKERIAEMLWVELPFVSADTDTRYAEGAKATRRIKTQRRHALEIQMRALAVVQNLELQLDVATRWVPGDEKWVAVSVMMRRRRYQRALNHLQGLIILHMFELAKCNMSGTGYKLRKHIAKALQACSKAVKNAIASYNR